MDYQLLKKLYAVSKEYGIDNDLLHDMVFSEFGSDSLKRLSDSQGLAIIERISGKKQYYKKCSPKGMASESQKKYISDMSYKLGWGDNVQRLSGFLKKYAGVESVEWLTIKGASKVIEGMKKMIERKSLNEDKEKT